MKSPDLIGEIIERMTKSVRIPITLKIRLGFDTSMKNAVYISKIAESVGASGITVHGRTREDFYTGKADWHTIAEVKSALSIPVVVNGDIKCYSDIEEAHEITGCSRFMIGRAALGNPFIFNYLKQSKGNDEYSNSLLHKVNVAKKHMQMLIADKGEKVGILEARKHIAWYLKGMNGAARLKKMAFELKTIDDLFKLLEFVLTNVNA